jgi:hypothetical protein
MSTGESWNAQGGELQYPYQSGLFHPIASNTEFNPVGPQIHIFCCTQTH